MLVLYYAAFSTRPFSIPGRCKCSSPKNPSWLRFVFVAGHGEWKDRTPREAWNLIMLEVHLTNVRIKVWKQRASNLTAKIVTLRNFFRSGEGSPRHLRNHVHLSSNQTPQEKATKHQATPTARLQSSFRRKRADGLQLRIRNPWGQNAPRTWKGRWGKDPLHGMLIQR